MDRRTFLKASGAAAAVAAMPSLPAFGAGGPKPWRDLVEWCKSLPNIQGYLTGAWTPEYTIGDHGSTWVGKVHTLVADEAFSPAEACEKLQTKIRAYLANDPEAVWWRMLPELRASWYVDEGAAGVTEEELRAAGGPPEGWEWVDKIALLERPHYMASARIAAFGGDPKAALPRKEGDWIAAARAECRERLKAKCGVATTILRDPWGKGPPLPSQTWHAEPPADAKMFQSASSVGWENGQSEWTTGKVVMPKRHTPGDQFVFLERTPS